LGYIYVPTVLRSAGFRVLVLFPPREHSPAHVHVVNADGLVVIELGTGRRSQRTVRARGMKTSDVQRAERLVSENTAALLEAWRSIHGTVD